MILVESSKSTVTLRFLSLLQAEEYCDKRLQLSANSFTLYEIALDKKNQIKSKKFIKVISNVSEGTSAV